jgi:hypothetical protein
MFSKTTDGGRTWSTPRVIVQTGAFNQTLGVVVVAGKSGGAPLYAFFDLIIAAGPHKGDNIAFAKSTDGGASWSDPRIISPIKLAEFVDPRTGLRGRTGGFLPAAAVDPVSEDLYVAWEDGRFSGGQYDEIALSTSADGGATWSEPARVNTSSGRPALTPTVAVGRQGDVGVTWYEVAPNLGGSLPTRYLFRQSPRGGGEFGREIPVVDEPFDALTAPYAGGLFLGDYEGLVAMGDGFRPVFVKTNTGDFANPTDVVTTWVTGREPSPAPGP